MKRNFIFMSFLTNFALQDIQENLTLLNQLHTLYHLKVHCKYIANSLASELLTYFIITLNFPTGFAKDILDLHIVTECTAF